MMRKKSNKGVTLISLTIYIIVTTICVGVLGSITSFFYGNIKKVRDDGKYAAEFDQFNMRFLEDVKSNSDVTIEDNRITFPNGSVYSYNAEDKGIYKGTVKIAKEVCGFTIEQKNSTINNVNKTILVVHIMIGKTTSTVFDQKFDYVLRYW